MQAQADVGLTHALSTIIAVRGERLALSRVRYSGRDQELETFIVEILVVVEINADDRFTAAVAFDTDDLDAAFAELDARYRGRSGRTAHMVGHHRRLQRVQQTRTPPDDRELRE